MQAGVHQPVASAPATSPFISATSVGAASRFITWPNATRPIRPKSRRNSSSAIARSPSAASRTSTGSCSMRGRHSQITCARASDQSTNVPASAAAQHRRLDAKRRCHAGTMLLPSARAPDDGGEQRERGDKRAAEQRERAIENRLRIHSRSMRMGAPASRSFSVCFQTRMFPRSVASGELWTECGSAGGCETPRARRRAIRRRRQPFPPPGLRPEEICTPAPDDRGCSATRRTAPTSRVMDVAHLDLDMPRIADRDAETSSTAGSSIPAPDTGVE